MSTTISKCYICDQSTLNEILITCCPKCQEFQCHQECFDNIYVFGACPVCKQIFTNNKILLFRLVLNNQSRRDKLECIYHKLISKVIYDDSTLPPTNKINVGSPQFGKSVRIFLPYPDEMWSNQHITDEINYLESTIRKLLYH